MHLLKKLPLKVQSIQCFLNQFHFCVINYLNINNIIIEAQSKKIKTIGELDNLVKIAKRKSDKTILIAIYNNQNQKRYIGVKLD